MPENFRKRKKTSSTVEDKANKDFEGQDSKEREKVDVLELPPRSSVHQNRKKRSSHLGPLLFFALLILLIAGVVYWLWESNIINISNVVSF